MPSVQCAPVLHLQDYAGRGRGSGRESDVAMRVGRGDPDPRSSAQSARPSERTTMGDTVNVASLPEHQGPGGCGC